MNKRRREGKKREGEGRNKGEMKGKTEGRRKQGRKGGRKEGERQGRKEGNKEKVDKMSCGKHSIYNRTVILILCQKKKMKT